VISFFKLELVGTAPDFHLADPSFDAFIISENIRRQKVFKPNYLSKRKLLFFIPICEKTPA
jgi:hypothetical protein